MEAEIIKQVPLAGECEEVAFGDVSGNCLWVRFRDSRWREWCGVFPVGHWHKSSVHVAEGALCFVVAGGFGYWVDADARRALYQTDAAWVEDAVAVPGRAQVAATDGNNIYLIGPQGIAWDSGRVALDGISFEEATETSLRGRVVGIGRSYPFTLTLDGPRFECPWEFPKEWDTGGPKRT